jgi:hypothetical protein
MFLFTADIRMALIKLSMLLAAFVLKYTWVGVPDQPGKCDEEMKAADFMVVRPTSEKCVVDLALRKI